MCTKSTWIQIGWLTYFPSGRWLLGRLHATGCEPIALATRDGLATLTYLPHCSVFIMSLSSVDYDNLRKGIWTELWTISATLRSYYFPSSTRFS